MVMHRDVENPRDEFVDWFFDVEISASGTGPKLRPVIA
jgi:hypothetical protein